MPLRLIVHGAAGRMGREVIRAAAADPAFTVAAALVRPGSPQLGLDAGVVAGAGPLGVELSADVPAGLAAGEVAVDFSTPAAAVEFAHAAADAGRPLVVATTGIASEQLEAVKEEARRIPLLIAPNLSVGISVLAGLLPMITRALGDDYDVEVIEVHHRHKKDAPSGTAIRLAEAVAAARGRALVDVERYGRRGIAPRAPGEIGMHAVRAGGVVGEHRLLFVSEGEEIEIAHRAFSRQTFALGALRAARFLVDRPPGLYTMEDVVG
ncbi:MAG: 4-hydroxy-tetrahydrodipicolinate reductase [Chloroflexi bacterium]|nr:4-hydroxy-tetrahydrodipicolinate reductase [Chloroflexota bacterium]